MSFLGRVFHNAFERPMMNIMSGGNSSSFSDLYEAPQQWAKDFKDWYDGTAAQRKANQMNVANWNMENAYNSPEAQMARYISAGLNPNLIYSQQNTAGSVASVSPAHSGAETIGKAAQTIASFYNIASLIASVKNLQQQNKNLQTQDTLLSAQADYVGAQADRYRYDTQWLRDHGISSMSPQFEREGQVLYDYARDFWSFITGKSGASRIMDVPLDYDTSKLSVNPSRTVVVRDKKGRSVRVPVYSNKAMQLMGY